jgi:hypothetical protein
MISALLGIITALGTTITKLRAKAPRCFVFVTMEKSRSGHCVGTFYFSIPKNLQTLVAQQPQLYSPGKGRKNRKRSTPK